MTAEDDCVMALRDPAGAAWQQLVARYRARRGCPAILTAGRLLFEYGRAARLMLRCVDAARADVDEVDRLLGVAGLLPIDVGEL